MGSAASMIWWDEEFCIKLSDKGYFVIRYDNRDTGCSTFCSPGELNYNVVNLVEDAIAILNNFNISSAHFVGMSLGGMIAQLSELIYPKRVKSLTLISSSVWDNNPDLHPIDNKVIKYHTNAANLDWSDKLSVVEYLAKGWEIIAGSKYKFDLDRYMKLSEIEFERANNLLSMFNHSLLGGGEEYYGKHKLISKPTLILHGSEDPVLPLVHAKALNNDIKNSKLIVFEGIGHELNSFEFDNYVSYILNHINKS
jgi:pimeloyl-ACP methyl ester carboxylesterase